MLTFLFSISGGNAGVAQLLMQIRIGTLFFSISLLVLCTSCATMTTLDAAKGRYSNETASQKSASQNPDLGNPNFLFLRAHWRGMLMQATWI
jgi:hypothetical protein